VLARGRPLPPRPADHFGLFRQVLSTNGTAKRIVNMEEVLQLASDSCPLLIKKRSTSNSAGSIEAFVRANVKTGTTLLTDGHRSYPGLTDY
jgi:hypothetical protein